jgi:hypothetical protein
MKKIFIGILCLVFFVINNGCSHNTDPQFRIRNEQLSKVNVNIRTSLNSKLSINNIEPQQTTEYQTAPVGNITAVAVIENESVSFLAAKNTHYTILIRTGKPPSVNVDE